MNKIYIILILLIIISSCKENTGTVSPVWPPYPVSDLKRKGNFISFSSTFSGNYDIWLAQVDTNGNLVTTGKIFPTNPYNLTQTLQYNETTSSWSSDGKILAYSRNSGTEQEIFAYFFNEDGSIDTTVSVNPRKIVNASTFVIDNNPCFSPNSLYMIWDRRFDTNKDGKIDSTDNRDVFRGITFGSGNNFVVTQAENITNSSNTDESNGRWSPRVFIGSVMYENSISSQSTDIYLIDPLNPDSLNKKYYGKGKCSSVSWSPACDLLIFETDEYNSGNYKIVSIGYPNPGTTKDIISSSNSSYRYPTRQPNRDLIAFSEIKTNNTSLILIMNVAGGSSFKLLPTEFENFENLYSSW